MHGTITATRLHTGGTLQDVLIRKGIEELKALGKEWKRRIQF